MIIDPNTAARTLQTVDKQLKRLADDQLAKVGNPSAGDVVELSGGGSALSALNQPQQGFSAGFTQLSGELSEQLAPLLSLIGGDTQRQGDLTGLSGDQSREEAIRSRAQELLDTYFSVEQTGDRIFNFAFSFFEPGEDREAFAREKQELIYEGFRQAEKQLGGLADISLQTRDYIDERIENFIGEAGSAASDDAA